MGAHDWTRMPDGLFHGFHTRWLTHMAEALNNGILPDEYSAEAELHFGRPESDVLTLRDDLNRPADQEAGGVAVADAPPKVRHKRLMTVAPQARPRTLAVRRVTGTLVAVIEIVSPANKDRAEHVTRFVDKVCTALRNGVHVVVLDIFPPNRHTPGGWHPIIEAELDVIADDDRQPQSADTPVALLSYETGGPDMLAYLEYLSYRDPLPDMPLFLAPGRYVNLPVESTYNATLRGMSKTFRRLLTGEAEQ